MANEISASGLVGGTMYYAVVRMLGQYVNGTTPEAYNSANWAGYAQGTGAANAAGDWAGTFPAVVAGVYDVQLRRRVGGSPAISDPVVGTGAMHWTGTAEIPLSAIKAKTDTITGDTEYTGPVDNTTTDAPTFRLIVGDGYESSTRKISFDVTSYAGPDPSGGTATLRIMGYEAYLTDASAEALVEADATATLDGDTLTFECVLSEAQTAALVPPVQPARNRYPATHVYQALVVVGDETVTIKLGNCVVTRWVPPVT